MADPRATVSFIEIEPVYATFKIDNSTITYDSTKSGGTASVGLAVTFSAVNTVALCADADLIVGKLIKVSSDNMATVQIIGGMTLPGGNGATLTVGTRFVGALGAASAKGYIRTVTAAATPTAAEVNNLAKGRGFIIDGTTDATNAQVFLI